jgi:chorismate mutase
MTAGEEPKELSAQREKPEATERSEDREELDRLRHEVERLDRSIVSLIAQRVACAREIGEHKRGLDLPTLDPAREAAVVRRAGELAREVGLPEEEVRAIYWQIIGLARRTQMDER